MQTINGLLRASRFQAKWELVRARKTRQKRPMAAAGSSTAGFKQQGRREADLLQLKSMRSDRDQYFATTGPPQR
jgi:hypothetical protein